MTRDEFVRELNNRLSVYISEDSRNSSFPPHAWGGLCFRDRVDVAAELCIENLPGDLVEIGALRGATTVKLARLAKLYNRRVLVIDPFEAGRPGGYDGLYGEFQRNIARYKDIVDVVRLPSQDPQAIEILKSRDICFTLIDGLHLYDACMSDVEAVSHTRGAIVLDDLISYGGYIGLMPALYDGAKLVGGMVFYNNNCREGYIVRYD